MSYKRNNHLLCTAAAKKINLPIETQDQKISVLTARSCNYDKSGGKVSLKTRPAIRAAAKNNQIRRAAYLSTSTNCPVLCGQKQFDLNGLSKPQCASLSIEGRSLIERDRARSDQSQMRPPQLACPAFIGLLVITRQ